MWRAILNLIYSLSLLYIGASVMGYSNVIVEIRDGIGRLYMNRPEKYNALNSPMLRELVTALNDVEGDARAKILVLSGRGKAFSAGIDLSELASAKDPDEAGKLFQNLASLFRKLLSLEKPLIIAVNGDAFGGGAELLWVGDAVVIAEGARISWAEARWGLIPPALSTLGILVLGPVRASYLAMSSAMISAKEALEMGLATHMAPLDKLEETVTSIARAFMENSPQALKTIKRVKRSIVLTHILELGISELERLSRTVSALDAARAFKEKRKPSYEW
ncbi:MAG: enoyl-CoA hydratase/isomerase family protein [Desulfurococcales archaeon]|nr:enoyl-CoA hydratase/isomerase family protein [Desulfurococcales archaeon]